MNNNKKILIYDGNSGAYQVPEGADVYVNWFDKKQRNSFVELYNYNQVSIFPTFLVSSPYKYEYYFLNDSDEIEKEIRLPSMGGCSSLQEAIKLSEEIYINYLLTLLESGRQLDIDEEELYSLLSDNSILLDRYNTAKSSMCAFQITPSETYLFSNNTTSAKLDIKAIPISGNYPSSCIASVNGTDTIVSLENGLGKLSIQADYTMAGEFILVKIKGAESIIYVI